MKQVSSLLFSKDFESLAQMKAAARVSFHFLLEIALSAIFFHFHYLLVEQIKTPSTFTFFLIPTLQEDKQ